MTLPKILDGMPEGVKHDRLIPWEAALRVLVPLIEINDPKRATAIPLFEEWVKGRDQEISVEQAAWLWDNFCTHFPQVATGQKQGRAYCGGEGGVGVNRPSPHRRTLLAFLALVLGVVAASSRAADAPAQKYPDVIAATVQASGPETFDFDVTVSSPYDTAQRYADSIRVMGRDGAVYGERKLVHDHADEQPFTRDLYGVKVPRGVRVVVVQGRDQRFGYGGKTLELTLPGR